MAGNILEYISPPYQNFKEEKTINVCSRECFGEDLLAADSGIVSTVWTANLLAIVPLILAEPITVEKFLWENGTAVAGNTDVGIYDFTGTNKLVSTGSTANSGTGVIQLANATAPTTLPANARLWLVLGSNSGTQEYLLSNMIVGGLDYIGYKQQAGGWSSGLPSSLTIATPTVAKLPMFGFSGISAL